MTTPLRMPKWAMGLEEGTIVQWLKAEGDRVTQGELIVEIETAKATQEVEAPVSGILSKILLAEGETAEVRTDIALIEEDQDPAA
ncbi:MAG TPA: biotin attachment protein [Rhodobacteraceae bacterium]|nr:biotin attachment protein [Paracoccaceae bacterium]